MKTIINEKTRLNGELVQVSKMDLQERETWVYRQFLSYAHRVSKYVAKRHGLNDIECECYIASGLYNKFLKLREKTLETVGAHYNSIEYLEYRHTLSLVRLVVNELNFKNATIETKKECITPDVEVSFKNGPKYIIKGAHVEASTEYENISKMATRKIDIIDLLKQWENRDSRSEARKVRQFVSRYIDDEGNTTDEETQLKGNYRTPEEEYFFNESIRQSLSLVSKIATECKYFNNVYRALTLEKLDDSAKSVLKRFRSQYGLDTLSLNELKYLFA